MANDRNAGRKPILTEKIVADIRERISAGESVSALAAEYGVSRQALYKRLKADSLTKEIRIDYLVDGELCSSIYVDSPRQNVRVVNYVSALSRRAFGYDEHPGMGSLNEFLKDRYLKSRGMTGLSDMLLLDEKKAASTVNDLICKGGLGEERIVVSEGTYIPRFEFSASDRVISRTDTDGYQMKAITCDRRFFVKSQALFAGLAMRDWAVEVISSDICRQLAIPCVVQRPCRFVYEGLVYDGVYSDNFELDGYTFISFDRLLERSGRSSRDDEFISLKAIDKMKWCASALSDIGGLPYEATLKYMLDLAVIDCLVGNVDRHTRNFGLFYNAGSGRFEIPLVFDNGMGLFEHDNYRDKYESFEAAMNNVYVAPYGEDPFEMMNLLFDEFDLTDIYPGLREVTYPDALTTPFALEYERRMIDLVRSKTDK